MRREEAAYLSGAFILSVLPSFLFYVCSCSTGVVAPSSSARATGKRDPSETVIMCVEDVIKDSERLRDVLRCDKSPLVGRRSV